MQDEPVRQITVKELHDNWVIDNPHYEFFFTGSKVVSTLTLAGKAYVQLEDNHNWYIADGQVIEIRPKQPLFVELTDPASLDETLPSNPATVAQQDHDENPKIAC